MCCTLRTPTLSNAGGPPQNPLKDGCGRQILMRVVHFEETDEKARAKADSYPLEPHFLEYYGIDEEFVVSTPIGFGSEPRSKGNRQSHSTVGELERIRPSPAVLQLLDRERPDGIGNPQIFERKIAEAQERLSFTSWASSHPIGTMSTELTDMSIRLFRVPVIPTSHASSQTVAPVTAVPQREGIRAGRPQGGLNWSPLVLRPVASSRVV